MTAGDSALPLILDRDVRCLDDGRVLLGGDPGRLVRLRRSGASALDLLAVGRQESAAVRDLGRTLLQGGLAHPRPAAMDVGDVIVVVPVRDRAEELACCLSALGTAAPVLVVDDGSTDPGAVAAVARTHGAQLIRLAVNAGPGGARNAGLAASAAAVVAFVDSDCTPPPGWLGALVGHFVDPEVGAVAPRVRGAVGGRSVLARYAAARGPLDLGRYEARVRPGSRVPYVPTAALLVRRAALPLGPAFDSALRWGEDVDLVWRLHDAGWSVRYDPRTVVTHAEPDRWWPWLGRRHRYGTSAAPLAQRHGSRLAPLVLPPWPTAAWLLLTSRRPMPALVCAAVPAVRLHLRLRSTGLPRSTCVRVAALAASRAVLGTGAGLGGAGLVVTAPLLLALLLRRSARATAAAVLLVPPLLEWRARRPALDPFRWTAVRLVDDLAYASGVWRGCLAGRTVKPLRPRTSRPT